MHVGRLLNNIRSPATLKHRALQSGLLRGLQFSITIPLVFAKNLILVQFLMPEAFGLMATITLLHVAMQLVSDIGLSQSVVREKRGNSDRFLQIVWTVKLMRAAVLSVITILIGVSILILQKYVQFGDSIYNNRDLPILIIISTLIVMANGSASPNILLAERELQNYKLVKLSVQVSIVSVALTVLLTAVSGSVYALMFGLVLSAALTSILSHRRLDGPRMRWTVDYLEMRNLWFFGRWLILSSLSTFLQKNIDKILFSIYLSSYIFSIYIIAFNLINIIVNLIGSFIGKVLYPVIGEMGREEISRYKINSQKIFVLLLSTSIGLFFAWPIIIGLIVVKLFPENYHAATEYLNLIALIFLHTPTRLYGMILINIGESRTLGVASPLAAGCSVFATWIALNHLGLEASIMVFALSPMILSQALFLRRGVRQLIGWQLNCLWLVSVASLSYWAAL
ncbi:MAG: oligosaccharide flippase family protein [Pseudomonadota bacterium]